MINRVRILRSILPKPIIFYSTAVTLNENTKSPELQRLLGEFTKAKRIILKLEKYDQLTINFNEWKNRIDVMKRYNFSELECFQMISVYPSILEIPLAKFEGSIQHWWLAELGTEYFKQVLQSQPILFEVDEAAIRNKIPQLRVLLGSTSCLAQLLMNSPNVMLDDWQGVISKIAYLLKVRRFKAGEITQCPALSESIEFIKFRFDLLEKCAVYKQSTVPIHKVNKYDRSGHVNPPLKSILTANLKEFLRIVRITEEEYEVCRDLFMANEDEDESESDDSDLDTDD